MTFQTAGAIRFYIFSVLEGHSVRHAIFTRHGGVSTGPLSSLNVGNLVGDNPDQVAENRRRSFRSIGSKPESAFEVWQNHSAAVQVAAAPRRKEAPYLHADALVTATPGVSLFMRFADCVPILLSDPVVGAIGLVHAGWMGTVRGVAAAAVNSMKIEFGCQPKNIVAGIGPSIGPDHYEVGPDVVARVEKTFEEHARELILSVGEKTFFNLWRANEIQLHQAGVGDIEVAGLCTGCHLEDWYSHRLESGRTGRFGALIEIH